MRRRRRTKRGSKTVRPSLIVSLKISIRVNSIHPGVIQTDMGQQTFVSRARNIGTNDVDAARQIALSTHPIGRLGVATDIAKGIVFLASDDAGFMTVPGLSSTV